MRFKFKNSSGFTFVELLVVIGIIGVLSVGAIVYINPATQLKRARDNQRLTEIKQIQSALEQYKGDHGKYPAFGTAASPVYGWAGISSIHLNTGGGSGGAVATITYLRNVPTGPNTGGQVCRGYVYAVQSPGQNYTLFVRLEDTNSDEAQAVKTAPGFPSGTLAADGKTFYLNSGTCAGASNYFNYWVRNP